MSLKLSPTSLIFPILIIRENYRRTLYIAQKVILSKMRKPAINFSTKKLVTVPITSIYTCLLNCLFSISPKPRYCLRTKIGPSP